MLTLFFSFFLPNPLSWCCFVSFSPSVPSVNSNVGVGSRTVSACDIPDLEIFPKYFNIPTVKFYAGLELRVCLPPPHYFFFHNLLFLILLFFFFFYISLSNFFFLVSPFSHSRNVIYRACRYNLAHGQTRGLSAQGQSTLFQFRI